MNDYVSLLLETDAAKRKLAQLFQSEEPGRATPPSTGIVTRDSSCAVRTDIEQNSKTLRESRREHGLVRARTRTAIPTIESGQVKRDLTVSSFVFTLVSVGAILAAYTDHPIFWLLIGPAPVAVLHTIMTFLRQRLRQREGLLEFYERNR
jgi:hypothetical protein